MASSNKTAWASARLLVSFLVWVTVPGFSGTFLGQANAAGLAQSSFAITQFAQGVELSILAAEPKRDTTPPSSGAKEREDDANSEASKSWDFKTRSPHVLRIERALLEPTEVSFNDFPLKEALEYVAEFHHISIMTDLKMLSEEGISIDTPVTLASSGISLRNTLQLFLGPMALDYVIRNDTLMITTEAIANETYEVRVYNTTRLPNLMPKELVDIITAVVEPGNWRIKKSPEAATTKVFAPGARADMQILDRNASSALSPAQAAVPSNQNAPNSAEAGGGGGAPEGSICAVGTTLVIRQTRRVHDEIIDLLDQLERQQAALRAIAAPKFPQGG